PAVVGRAGTRGLGRRGGVDAAGPTPNPGAVRVGLPRHAALLGDPLSSAAAFGGRELAAILGAALVARQRRIPVLLDGFVCLAAGHPVAKLRVGALPHHLAARGSAGAAPSIPVN